MQVRYLGTRSECAVDEKVGCEIGENAACETGEKVG